MKRLNKILVAIFALILLSVLFSLCAYASGGERYEASITNPNKHDVIINGQKVGEAFHRAEIEATCQKKAVCHDCKAEFGELAPHDFLAATCTNPKTCTVCDYQEGGPIEHSGGQAGCLELAVCSDCGAEYGEILGHTGGEDKLSCTSKAICERCGEAYGATRPHIGGTPNCQTPAICTVCGSAYGELGEHIISESWVIEKEFHYQTCAVKGCEGEVFNDGDHTDENKDGKCDICLYRYQLSKGQKILFVSGLAIGTAFLIVFSVFGIIKASKRRKEME